MKAPKFAPDDSLAAKGEQLDCWGKVYGLARKRWFWIFKESDESYRLRLYQRVTKGVRSMGPLLRKGF